jgi:hypothetical protein
LLFLAAGLLTYLPSAFGVDSWLALVGGREIWQSGLPHHETWTVMANGIAWVDQQWLAQLATYGLDRVGGLGLLGAVNISMIILGIGGAVTAARRLGAGSRTVMLLLPLCVWMIVPAGEVRAQTFVIPLFVLTVYLLSSDSRSPSRRVYWCLPILVLWANLHGTASLAMGLVMLRGLTLAWERRGMLARAWKPALRPLALTLGPPLCLLLTPYGLHVVSYYHHTLLNSALKHAVTEWQPITSSPVIAAPFFLLAGTMVWSFGRRAARSTPWERLALMALAAVSISVIRNVVFFALCALILVPVSLGDVGERGHRDTPVRPRINAILAAAALALAVTAVVATLERPAAEFESSQQPAALLDTVRAAIRSDPELDVLADVRFADWLLWRDPGLRGRVAIDIRYELYSAAQITRIQRTFEAVGPAWKQAARGYRLVVLDVKADPDSVAGFLAERGHRVLYDDGQRIVIQRSGREAG